jgi:hypothetical protein
VPALQPGHHRAPRHLQVSRRQAAGAQRAAVQRSSLRHHSHAAGHCTHNTSQSPAPAPARLASPALALAQPPPRSLACARYCGENAHQCRQCRNINYDRPDAFLCIECGYCRCAPCQ